MTSVFKFSVAQNVTIKRHGKCKGVIDSCIYDGRIRYRVNYLANERFETAEFNETELEAHEDHKRQTSEL